jgi:hypothetical protein
MLKSFFIVLFTLLSTCLLSQEDQGSYKLYKSKKAPELAEGKSRLTIQFIGPTGKPVTSRIKFAMNKDSVVPVIDETGSYTFITKASKYKFNFVAPWWYNVPTDSIELKPQKATVLRVQFEAMEFRLDEK